MCAKNGQGKTVYRGLPGLDLTEFKQSHGFSESGFLSTTSDIDVALEYSGVKENRVATVLAYALSQIDNGAEIVDFSQHPSERETLINASCFCEYQRGQDEMRMTPWGAVRVLHVKVNANLRAQTREELEDRRKNVVVNMLDVVAKDVRQELLARVHSDQVRQRASKDYDMKWYVSMSVVLPAMLPCQYQLLRECIAAAAGAAEYHVNFGEPEAVAAGTMQPITVAFNYCDIPIEKRGEYTMAAAERAAAEGLAGDKVKAALQAAGFGAAHLVAPASVLTPAQDDFVASILEESEARVRVYKEKPGSWFTHNNSRLAKAVSDGLALPLLARAKFDLWLHSDPRPRGLVIEV
jgi:hypothetical protein